MSRSVHRAEPAPVRRADHRSATRGCGAGPRGRPWSLPLDDRVLLVAVYRRTNLPRRRLGPVFDVPTSAADRSIDPLGPALALQQRKRFRKDMVPIVDGILRCRLEADGVHHAMIGIALRHNPTLGG